MDIHSQKLPKITAKARTVVNESLDILKNKLKYLSDLINRTKTIDIEKIKKDSDAYINKVNQISDDFIGIVNSVKEIHITRASDYYVTEKHGINFSVSKLEKTYKEYQIICTKLEQLQLQKHHVAFFNVYKSLKKELKELDDIPNIQEPLSIEQFKGDDYTDLVIEKIQNKYQILRFKLKENEIMELRHKQEKLISIQETKDAELHVLRQEMEKLKAEEKQNKESFTLKKKEIQHLYDFLRQEYKKLVVLQIKKDTGLLAMRQEIERLKTERNQNDESLKSKEEIIQELELERSNLREIVKIKDDEIQHLIESQRRDNFITILATNSEERKRVGQEMFNVTELPEETTFDDDFIILCGNISVDTDDDVSSVVNNQNDAEENDINIFSGHSDLEEVSSASSKNGEFQSLKDERTYTEQKPTNTYLTIHLGDTQSGIVWAVLFGESNHICQTWVAETKHHYLFQPMSLLLNRSLYPVSFGFAAEKKFLDLFVTNCHHEWYFFKRFLGTIELPSNQYGEKMVTTTDGQKQFPALTLCSIAVKCFIDDLRKTYSTDSSILDVLQDVMKILIVPDRWQNFKTEFMLTVSKEAGINDQELMIVTESEAAFANVQQDFITNDPGSWGSCQKSSFIVLNCGGNTLDITINQIEEATSIKQILNKQVNNCGWILVKEGFIKFMIDVFGSAIHAKWCCEYSDESVDFYRSVECKIFRFNQKPDVITIKLPISFCQILENETGLDANSLIAQAHFAGELSIVSDKLRIKSSLFKTIFNDALKSITMQLQSVLAVFNICKIILVGSFCENRVVVETLRESYPDIDIYVSNKASVMRGATLSRQYI